MGKSLKGPGVAVISQHLQTIKTHILHAPSMRGSLRYKIKPLSKKKIDWPVWPRIRGQLWLIAQFLRLAELSTSMILVQ